MRRLIINIERVIYRIEDLIKPSIKLLPDSERAEVALSPEGKTVSVETALNSRCTSDYDGNPRKFHWGMFDRTRKLSDKQIKEVIGLAKIPRFTDQRVEIQCNSNMLTFVVETHTSGTVRDWGMVESGMQQQSVGLVCAALGVGMVLKNLGKDGALISATDYATIKAKLDAMKPSYDGSFWSDLPPAGRNPLLRGNLPDPVRKGNRPLIPVLSGVRVKNEGSEILTEEIVSQLLWAARGRTPHLYKSRPWGLTIPTWGGEQDISSLYLISANKLSQYINWANNKPTHSLLYLKKIDRELFNRLEESFSVTVHPHPDPPPSRGRGQRNTFLPVKRGQRNTFLPMRGQRNTFLPMRGEERNTSLPGGRGQISTALPVKNAPSSLHRGAPSSPPSPGGRGLGGGGAELSLFSFNDNMIVLGRNENLNRSLWEVGYQLLNILLQAHALDMSYEAALLDEGQKTVLRTIGIKDPVAIVAL